MGKDTVTCTQARALPEMLLATNQVRNIWFNIVGVGTTIDLDPLSNLLRGTNLPKISGHRNRKGLERLLHLTEGDALCNAMKVLE